MSILAAFHTRGKRHAHLRGPNLYKVSTMAIPAPKPTLRVPKGFRFAGVTAGIKPSGKPDLALIVSDTPATTAGVFTKNRFCGAPVTVSKAHLRAATARAIVVNAGVANVATGKQGLKDAKAMCARVAEHLGCRPTEVLVASTGVIGPRLPMDKVLAGIDHAATQLGTTKAHLQRAATAIMTTDTRMKTFGHTEDGITVAGMAKGSGMIAPDLATMLGFILTDTAVDPAFLKQTLRESCDNSFNRISVDGDTSTSDMVLVLANGAAASHPVKPRSRKPVITHDVFESRLDNACEALSNQILWDGEGTTRVFSVMLLNARNKTDLERVGRSIINSPLVKSAIHGGDANWGRFAMAIGKSGAPVNPAKISISIAAPQYPIMLLDKGEPTQLTASLQKDVDKAMKQDEVDFLIDLGQGNASGTFSGSDLSAEYVSINADYTT